MHGVVELCWRSVAGVEDLERIREGGSVHSERNERLCARIRDAGEVVAHSCIEVEDALDGSVAAVVKGVAVEQILAFEVAARDRSRAPLRISGPHGVLTRNFKHLDLDFQLQEEGHNL